MSARGWALAAALALGVGPAPGAVAATSATLEAARAQLAEAGAGLAGAREAEVSSAELVKAIADYEAALAALRAVVIEAGGQERELALALAGRREEIMQLVATLQTVGRVRMPPPALHPAGPLDAARAGMVLAQAAPALRAEAEEVAELMAALDRARTVQQAGLSELAAGLVALEAAREDMAARMPATPPAPDPALVALVRESDTLTALAAGLAGPATEAAAPAEGTLAWPVAGRILLGFNEPDGGGARRPGIQLGAPALSLVVAPAAGTVRYAGPFLDFGYVVVLQIEGGALLVLAGVAELNVATGTEVARGDLLGRLGGRTLGVEEYVMLPHAETGAGALETLYIEIRQGRGPVDPEPWFDGGSGWEGDR